MNAADEILYSGAPADASSPIELAGGWNWTGYLPQSALELNYALNSLSNGIHIKSQTQYADFYPQYGNIWGGTMTSMYPLTGYQINMADDETLIYPDDGFARAMNPVVISEEEMLFNFNFRNFEFNGVISASVNIDNTEIAASDMLISYIDGECRGYTKPLFFPLTNEYFFPLMTYSSYVEEGPIVFEYYNASEDRYYQISETIDFESDMIVGNGVTPFEMNGFNNEIMPDLHIVSAYPNPFNPVTNIEFSIAEPGNVQVIVYDVMGRKVDMIQDGYMTNDTHIVTWNAGNRASGIYYVQIMSADNVKTQKVVLLK